MSNCMPVLFVSHGAPTFALAPGQFGAALERIGRTLPAPKAVVVISSHWLTPGPIEVTTSSQPETLHDFSGFPPALYAVRYPAPGAPEVAQRVQSVLSRAGWPVRPQPVRGLDHGAWIPLRYLYPQADVPVVQVSLPDPFDTVSALQLGWDLAALRSEGILLLGAGGITHNLDDLLPESSAPPAYVSAFTDWVRKMVRVRDLPSLAAYRELAPAARRAHPTKAHFLPLLVAIGAAADDSASWLIDGGVSHGVLAMDAYVLGQWKQATP